MLSGLMQVMARRTLREFWEREPHAEMPLRVWYAITDKANWAGPSDITAQFSANVDFVGDNHVIFDIGGNTCRLIVHLACAYQRALIKFVGTHKEYDRIDAETV